MRGSWDNSGYCSERGGGVHQICFDVTPDFQVTFLLIQAKVIGLKIE